MENTKPIIPAVEGMLISMPLIRPMTPIFLGRSLFKRAYEMRISQIPLWM